MTNPTIAFTQDTLFELFRQSAKKFGLNGSAKIYVTDIGGTLKVDHFGPETITPGGISKVLHEPLEEPVNNSNGH